MAETQTASTSESLTVRALSVDDFIWTETNGSWTVELAEGKESNFLDSLTVAEPADSQSPPQFNPVLEEELLAQIKEDNKKKAAFDKFLKEKSKKTYEEVVQKALEKKIWDSLEELLKQMSLGGQLDEFLKDAAFKSEYEKLLQNSASQQTPDYQTLRVFCQQLEKTASQKRKEFEDAHNIEAKSYNSIHRAVTQMGVLYNFDVPKYVGGMRSLLTLDEDKHYKKPKKRKWWQRLWDNIKVFIGVETRERIEEYQYAMGSLGRAITKYTAESTAGMFTNNTDQYINYLRNNNLSKDKKQTGKRIQFELGEAQPKADVAEKNTSNMRQALNAGIAVGKVALAGVGGASPWQGVSNLVDWVGGKDEAVLQENLSEHLEKAFSYEAKKQAFETMMNFVRDMYVISEQTYAYGSEKDVAKEMTLAKIGFERLGEDNFRDFVLKLSTSLGFDIETYKRAHPELASETDLGLAVHLLFNADETMKQEAFKNFLQGDPERGVGLRFASDAFKKEFNYMKSQPKETSQNSDNYFYIMDLNMQVIEDLYMKTLNKNAIREALRAGQIEERVYNPNAKSAGTAMTGAIKQQLVDNLPNAMQSYMQSAADKSKLAQDMSGAYCQGIANEYHQRYKEKYPVVSSADQTQMKKAEKGYMQMAADYLWWFAGYDESSEPKTTAVDTNPPPVQPEEFQSTMMYKQQKRNSANESKWQAAQTRVDEAGVPKIVQSELADIVREKTNKVWQKQAKHTIGTVLDWGGMKFLQEVNNLLSEEFASLQDKQAHPEFVNEIEGQLKVLAEIFGEYERDPNKYKKLTLEDTKKLFDALRTGVSLKYAKGNYKNIDDQSDTYMVMMALNQLNTIYLTPEIALRLYENVLPTDFDEIPREGLSSNQKYAIGKVAQISDNMLKEAMSGPIKQFEYYAKRSSENRIATEESAPIIKEEAPVQGWISWGASSAWSLMTGAIGLSMDAITVYTGNKLTNIEIKTPEELNQIIVDSTHEYIRGSFFDASFNMVNELYDLVRVSERHEYFQDMIGDENKVDVFAKYGFTNQEDVMAFIDQLASDLGFDNAKALYDLNNKDTQQTKKLIDKKRSDFAKVRKSEHDKKYDPFVSAKLTIRNENAKLLKQAKSGSDKLKNGSNYMVALSALNSMVDSVEMCQRETLAVELLLPEQTEKLGLSEEQRGLWQSLVDAGKQRAKEYGQEKIRQGMAAQMNDAITRASNFPTAMIDEVANNLRRDLEKSHQITVIDEEIIDSFIAKTGSPETAIEFFMAQKKANIEPYVINALAEHIVLVNRPEAIPQLMALEKEKLEDFDEVYFWKDLIERSFSEENPGLATQILRDYVPKNLQETILSDLVNDFDKFAMGAKSYLDYTLMISQYRDFNEDDIKLLLAANQECIAERDDFNQVIKPTARGISQWFSDNDGKVLDRMREVYQFMDHATQLMQAEMVHITEDMQSMNEGTELNALKLEAHLQKLERYQAIIDNFPQTKDQWFKQDMIARYTFQTEDRKSDITTWDSQIDEILKESRASIAETEKQLKRKIKHLKCPKPQPDAGELILSEPPQVERRSSLRMT